MCCVVFILYPQVTGFSIGGRVVDGNGAGVDGAKVLVDGQERSVTDESGYYKLDQVSLASNLITYLSYAINLPLVV